MHKEVNIFPPKENVDNVHRVRMRQLILYAAIDITTGTSGGILDIAAMAIKSPVTAMREAAVDRFIRDVSERVEFRFPPLVVPLEHVTLCWCEQLGERFPHLVDEPFAITLRLLFQVR